MKVLNKYLFTLLWAFLVLPVQAQVTVSASIDSLQLLIGEQAHAYLREQ